MAWGPGGRRTATAGSPSSAAGDQELIRWYLEDYPQLAADIGTRGIARRAERLLADLGGQLFGRCSRDPRHRSLWDTVQPGLDGTRVEIVTDVAGATALPWELLRDPEPGRPSRCRPPRWSGPTRGRAAPHMPRRAAALRVCW